MDPDKSVDCTGLFCPMPIMRTKQEIATMKPGEILEIIADDPGFADDLPIWCAAVGEKFVAMKQEGPLYIGYVEKR